MLNDDLQEIADRVYAASAWFSVSDEHLKRIILNWYYERNHNEIDEDRIKSMITVLQDCGYIVRDAVTCMWGRGKNVLESDIPK